MFGLPKQWASSKVPEIAEVIFSGMMIMIGALKEHALYRMTADRARRDLALDHAGALLDLCYDAIPPS